jgi:hypothetical protein
MDDRSQKHPQVREKQKVLVTSLQKTPSDLNSRFLKNEIHLEKKRKMVNIIIIIYITKWALSMFSQPNEMFLK